MFRSVLRGLLPSGGKTTTTTIRSHIPHTIKPQQTIPHPSTSYRNLSTTSSSPHHRQQQQPQRMASFQFKSITSPPSHSPSRLQMTRPTVSSSRYRKQQPFFTTTTTSTPGKFKPLTTISHKTTSFTSTTTATTAATATTATALCYTLAGFPFQQTTTASDPKSLTRNMDIDYYANEEHYKEEIRYVQTPDIVVNIRQIQRIIMKDTFLCKKYCRYIIETVEDAKRLVEQAEKRLGTMIEITTHEPTNEVYRNYILKLDSERSALEGYLNLALLCVMPVASITKHFKGPLDEKNNEGGLDSEFTLVQEQFDIVHEQLNQLRELSAKSDGLVEVTEKCVQMFLKEMTEEIEGLQENQLPRSLQKYVGQQTLSDVYINEDGKSSSKFVTEADIDRIFQTITDPTEREAELRRIDRDGRRKKAKEDLETLRAVKDGHVDMEAVRETHQLKKRGLL